MLRGACDKGRENSEQMKRELRQGRENAKQEVADSPLTRDESPPAVETQFRR
ncbi:MAG TPA: hypothetical protein VGK79_09170 [Gaiellaceae bacterium]